MHSIRMPRGDTPTFLTHLFGGGLDDDKYRVERFGLARRRRHSAQALREAVGSRSGNAGHSTQVLLSMRLLGANPGQRTTLRTGFRNASRMTVRGSAGMPSASGTVTTSGGVGRRSGGDIANAVPGQVSLPDVRERSPGPDDRPCFESASPGRAEPAAVLVPAGFGLRGCGILHCRFADRRPRRVTGRRTRRVVSLRLHLQLRGHAR